MSIRPLKPLHPWSWKLSINFSSLLITKHLAHALSSASQKHLTLCISSPQIPVQGDVKTGQSCRLLQAGREPLHVAGPCLQGHRFCWQPWVSHLRKLQSISREQCHSGTISAVWSEASCPALQMFGTVFNMFTAPIRVPEFESQIHFWSSYC